MARPVNRGVEDFPEMTKPTRPVEGSTRTASEPTDSADLMVKGEAMTASASAAGGNFEVSTLRTASASSPPSKNAAPGKSFLPSTTWSWSIEGKVPPRWRANSAALATKNETPARRQQGGASTETLSSVARHKEPAEVVSWCGADPHVAPHTTLALVPWKAKALAEPTRVGLKASGAPVACLGAMNPPAAPSMGLNRCGFTVLKCRTGGAFSCSRKPPTRWWIPTIPAPASAWPAADLAAPKTKILVPRVENEETNSNAEKAALISMGSPSAVPVPCICRQDTDEGSAAASSRADWTSLCCAGPLGAVRPLLRPSWLTPDPRRRTEKS